MCSSDLEYLIMPKRSNGRKGTRRNNVVAVRRAPGMQNMQQVDRWDLAEIVPITVPVSADSS